MPLTFHALDEEFAAATGDNVNVTVNTARFDNPPNAFTNLAITAAAADPDPRHFEAGDSYDLSWGGFGGGGSITGAVVVRSDMAPNGGGIVVFEGTDDNGDLTQIIWTPGFDLEEWYWNNYTPAAEPRFYVEDVNRTYSHQFMCFAEDTRIATAMGHVRAGDLWEGDRVTTLECGACPVLWVGRRVVRGQGAGAPVLFAPGTIGNHTPLRLSQQHRVLLRSPRAELMFGSPEVLVPAKALVDGRDIRFAPCRWVAYVHLLLPDHHLLSAEGAWCESLLPGEMVADYPGLAGAARGRPYAPARPVLSFAEALSLIGTAAVPVPPMPEAHGAALADRCL